MTRNGDEDGPTQKTQKHPPGKIRQKDNFNFRYYIRNQISTP